MPLASPMGTLSADRAWHVLVCIVTAVVDDIVSW